MKSSSSIHPMWLPPSCICRFLRKMVFLQHCHHLRPLLKISLYIFYPHCHLTFALSLSSKRYVSLNDGSVNHKLMMPLWKSSTNGTLFRDCGISRSWTSLEQATGNMKMLTLYKHFENKTQCAAEKYQSAWCALCTLDPNSSWSTWLKELKKEHVSGPRREPNDVSNSHYQLLWIWLVPCVNSSNDAETTLGEDEFNQGMHVEWAKARARMQRWKEELLIV